MSRKNHKFCDRLCALSPGGNIMSKVSKRFAVALVAVLFPIAAFADLSGTVTVSANQSLNLETGAAASSGGDLLWNGTTLTPQGKAKALNVTTSLFALSGTSGYATLNQALLQAGASFASSSP